MRHPGVGSDLTCTQAAVGGQHTVRLRCDGIAVACSLNGHSQCDLPALAADLTYTEIAARGYLTVLLRSDRAAGAVAWTAMVGATSRSRVQT